MKNKRKKSCCLKIYFTAIAALFAILNIPAFATDIKIHHSSQDEILISINNIQYKIDNIQIDGRIYNKLSAVGEAGSGNVGEPELPVITRQFGIPSGKEAHIELLETDFLILEKEYISPVPEMESYRIDDNNQIKYKYVFDKEVYSTDSFIPAAIEKIPNTGFIRKQNIGTLAVHPVQYNPLKKELKVYKYIKLLIRFTERSNIKNVSGENRINLKHYKESFKNLLNFSDVMKWNSARPIGSNKRMEKEAAGFSPGDFYYKFQTEADGLYKVTYDYLIAGGVDVSAFNPQTIKLFNKGEEVPVYVNGEQDGTFDNNDYIIFYGTRNTDSTEYFNLYSNRNVYWLTWGGNQGKRFEDYDGTVTAGTDADFYRKNEHYEKDVIYNGGDVDSQQRITAQVEGERWYWTTFEPQRIRDFNIYIYGLETAGGNAKINLKLHGVTTGDHHLTLDINGSSVGEIIFHGRVDYNTSLDVDNNILSEGKNVFSIKSNIPSGILDLLYLDWMEVVYPRKYQPHEDNLIFALPENNGTNYIINGFKNNDIEVFDITNLKRITNTQISPDGSNFTVSFKDSRPDGGRIYYTAAGEGFLLPSAIEKVEFENFRNTANEVDYLIITHKKFQSFANSLAEYRAGKNNYLTMVADIEHIYDEFNYGIMSPEAVRDFLKYAYDNWNVVPSFVVLFGDASWDYRKIGYESRYDNYVPSYGFPASDNWFVSLDGDEDILPDMYLGRIPAETEEQAENYINKVFVYESGGYGAWSKNVLLITGGINNYEQNLFKESANIIINEIISGQPSGMKSTLISKTSSEFIDFSHRDEIIELIDKGVLWVNSSGHAAPQVYDVDFGRPSDLNNYPRFPFMSGMSCNTARFANPNTFSLAEDYVFTADRGTAAYFGSTAQGIIQLDNVMQEWMFKRVFVDTVRMAGIFTADSKYRLWEEKSSWYPQETTNLINQYTLIGDPCFSLALPVIPDLAITIDDIVLSSDIPNESDNQVDITAHIKNYGLVPPDSVTVSVLDEFEGVGISPIKENIRIKPVGYNDSVSVKWDIEGKKGNHNITVTIDPNDFILEADENNNSASKPVTVFSSDISLLKPRHFSIVNSSNVELKISTFAREQTIQKTIFFEADTTGMFSSPVYVSGPVDVGSTTTGVMVNLPFDKTTYYWRARSFDGINYSQWESSVFSADFSTDSVFSWNQSGKLFNENLTENLKITDKITLSSYIINFRSESAGHIDGNYAALFKNVEILDIAEYDTTLPIELYNQGFYIAAVDDKSGQLINGYHYNTHLFTAHSDAMADYINAVKDNNIVIGAVISDGSMNLTQNAKNALKTIGSSGADNLEFQDSFAFIGKKGALFGSIPEEHKSKGTGRAVVEDSISAVNVSGKMVSQIIEGAEVWETLTISGEIPSAGDGLSIILLGINNTGRWDTLYKNIQLNSEFDISGINPLIYRRLRLSADFSDDDGIDTPSISQWNIKYKPASDLYTNYKHISVDRDSVFVGENVSISADIHNIGYSVVDSAAVSFYAVVGNQSYKIGSNIILTSIPAGGYKTAAVELNTAGYNGSIQILAAIDPGDNIVELSDYNNEAVKSIFVLGDDDPPTLDVTFDGKRLTDGEYVSQEPEIRIQIKDTNPGGIQDTTNIELYLDNNKISFYNNPEVQFITHPGSGEVRAEIVYKPSIEDGTHILKAIATDMGGNSNSYEINFVTSSRLEITNVYNFPNPISKDTYFTYVLTKKADNVSIKIFTVSGRLIKAINDSPNKAGYNQVFWNGKDEDSDALANGVYLYKIIAKNKDEQNSVLQKCVIMK
ncbi:C25 family cysteine peptidase [candidate division KSB1 bacterium]